MSRKLMLLVCLFFSSQMFFLLPIKSNLIQSPPATIVGRYTLSEDRYWIVYNKTVQQLRDEGYDVSGDPDWPLHVNYTRFNYSFKSTIIKLSWPNVTLQNIEGEYDLNVTAHRIMGDGNLGEKIASFIKVNQPPRMGLNWETRDPDLGIMFNPSAFVIGNSFSIEGKLLEYNVNRTEILKETPWGQNETYVLYGEFANASHSIKTVVWCDAESGIVLKQIWDSKAPTYISREEMITVETGIKMDEFEVVYEEEIYKIHIDTNSTIDEFAVDPTVKKISLAVNGSTGTSGTCNVTIPKDLVPAHHNIEVYIDGQKTDYQILDDADNYYIYVEYQHSTRTITISFVPVAIWTQYWFWLIVAAGIMVVVGAVYFLKKKQASVK